MDAVRAFVAYKESYRGRTDVLPRLSTHLRGEISTNERLQMNGRLAHKHEALKARISELELVKVGMKLMGEYQVSKEEG